jgi:ferredoxin
MQLRVDPDMCTGHGRCYALAPEVFGADEFGHAEVLLSAVPDGLRDQAMLAVQNCPEQAITFED